jgi:hypothetical protein
MALLAAFNAGTTIYSYFKISIRARQVALIIKS